MNRSISNKNIIIFVNSKLIGGRVINSYNINNIINQ